MKKGGSGFARRLVAWFARAQRPMPWRRAPSPYVCWLSEIMMQQTTYATVLPYYERFLARFPDVQTLAAAEERDVLKAWEGDRDGGQDVYQMREFGTQGPMGREGFGELAGRLMGQLAEGKAR